MSPLGPARRRRAALAVVALAGGAAAMSIASTTTGPAPAVAEVEIADVSAPAVVTDDGVLHVALGSGGSAVVDGELFGRVVVVPGDTAARTLRVTNDGPEPGTLTASIVNATALDDASHPAWVDDAFYDHLTVAGRSASSLVGATTTVRTADLAPGEGTDVVLDYGFLAWTGNRTGGGLHPEAGEVNPGGVGPREFRFDVLLAISGDDDAGAATSGYLTHTGGAALAGRSWLLLVAGGLVLVAAGARTLARRASAPVDGP